jgi:DNA-binding winged helix-turn-helix (wHTH) protein
LGQIYEFGDFRVDSGRRVLLRLDGRTLPLTPKAFDTLLYMVQHADAILEKGMLMNALWPDTTVEENNLNQSISALRRALGGDRNDHRYIVTVPGRGYQFVASVQQHKAAETVSAESVESLAVLPFQPLMPTETDASLELGMADTLITRLSCIRGLIMRPLSAVRKYADFNRDALLAGRELGVDFILDGSLQHSGNKVRVTVRLLNVSTGAALWAGTFDEEMTDIFAVQDAMAERVVQALALELSTDDRIRLTKRFTENVKAYRLYLKGRYYWWKDSPAEYTKSRDYFHRAVEEDPSYALGYCGLNSFYGFGAASGLLPPEEGWPKAEWAITKALDLDDNLAEAHLGLAALKMVYYLDWAGAEQEAKRAIELNSGFDEIHYLYSFYLLALGRFDESISEAKRALACNPFSVRISQHLGQSLYCARMYDEAIRQFAKTLQLDSNYVDAYESFGDAYVGKGQYHEAVAQWNKGMILAGDEALSATLTSVYAEQGFNSAVRAVATKKLERLKQRKDSGEYIPAMNFARTCLRAGDRTQALRYLTLACEERNVYALMIGSDPVYDPLRTEQGFIRLLHRMKLAPKC